MVWHYALISEGLKGLEVYYLGLRVVARLHHRGVKDTVGGETHWLLRIETGSIVCLQERLGGLEVLHLGLVLVTKRGVEYGGLVCHVNLALVHLVWVKAIEHWSHGVIVVKRSHPLRIATVLGQPCHSSKSKRVRANSLILVHLVLGWSLRRSGRRWGLGWVLLRALLNRVGYLGESRLVALLRVVSGVVAVLAIMFILRGCLLLLGVMLRLLI